MNRNLLLIVRFIIIFCWMFKVFEKKIDTRFFFKGRNLRKLLSETGSDPDHFDPTFHNRSNDNNCSLNYVSISEISPTGVKSITMPPSDFPCTSTSEASDETEFKFDKSIWELKREITNISSGKIGEEIGATSNTLLTSSNELSYSSKVTTDDYANFDNHNLENNNTIILNSSDAYTDPSTSDKVNEMNKLVLFLKEQAPTSKASYDSNKTSDDILELDMPTRRIGLVPENSSNIFEKQSSYGNSLLEPNLTKSVSIKNQYSRRKGDNVHVMNYIHDLYDAVVESFAKLEEVRNLVNDIKSEMDHIQGKIQRLSSNDETTRNLLEDSKCTFLRGLDHHKTNVELLEALKLNIDRGFIEVDELMADLSNRLTVYEELYQSNNQDPGMFETARIEILRIIRSVTSRMNSVQKDSNRFLKYLSDFKIVCK